MFNGLPTEPHSYLVLPPPETVICRFLDIHKFRDLFASEELYFRRLDKFKESDPREALASEEWVRKALRLSPLDVNDEIRLNNEQAYARQNSEGYFISCWNIFEVETLKMWAEYGNCVCVFSRIELLQPELDRQLDQIIWGAVRYSEKDRIGYNLIDFAFTKTYPFEHERELRILLQCYDPLHRTGRNLTLSNFAEREPIYGPNPWLPDCKRRRINLKSVVAEIRLSPWIDASTIDEIRHWIHVKNFDCAVIDSALKSPFTPSLEDFKKSMV
jgi:hypothetical protein